MAQTRYFEDIEIGEKIRTGAYELTEEKIVEFASVYDPQFIHIDKEQAKRGPFGQIIASGWQTLSVAMRLIALEKPFGDNPLIGMRIDDIQFSKPVFPNTTLFVDVEIVGLKPSKSGERGYVSIKGDVKDASNEELVATQIWTIVLPVGTTKE